MVVVKLDVGDGVNLDFSFLWAWVCSDESAAYRWIVGSRTHIDRLSGTHPYTPGLHAAAYKGRPLVVLAWPRYVACYYVPYELTGCYACRYLAVLGRSLR